MRNFTTVILAIILLAACSTQKKVRAKLDSWMGHTRQELIMSWGPPARTASDGNNGQVLIYSKRVYGDYGNLGIVDYYEHTMFYVNSDNRVYHWIKRSDPNPPDRVDIRLTVN